MIELKQLSKSYGETTVVNQLDLTFPSGQITALLGPSGCGKTTTLRMINRLTEPSSGHVLLNGQDHKAQNVEQLRRGMGYVIQQIGLFPHWNVTQNIATVPNLLGHDKSKTKARIKELLHLVGLEPEQFAHKKPSELSGGQAQRVGVARALAADPPVLLMDEPFGALDPLARENLQEAFLDIQQQLNKTVVMVTHDIDEALRLGDQIALMNMGRLEQCGPSDELIQQPSSEFVRQFLGEDASLRQLAAFPVKRWGEPLPSLATDLPSVRISQETNARSAISVMLREHVDALTLTTDDDVPVGIVRWERLRDHNRLRSA